MVRDHFPCVDWMGGLIFEYNGYDLVRYWMFSGTFECIRFILVVNWMFSSTFTLVCLRMNAVPRRKTSLNLRSLCPKDSTVSVNAQGFNESRDTVLTKTNLRLYWFFDWYFVIEFLTIVVIVIVHFTVNALFNMLAIINVETFIVYFKTFLCKSSQR